MAAVDQMYWQTRVRAILEQVSELLPRGEWVLGGSGPLALRGIRDVGDVDIFCTTRAWFELAFPTARGWAVVTPDRNDLRRRCDPPFLRRRIYGKDVDIFHSWRTREDEARARNFDTNRYLREAEEYDGFPVVPLEALLALKRTTQREKDVQDIRAIETYLAAGGR